MDRSESATAAAGAPLVGAILAHHGVSGMKWGHRKGSSESSSKSPAAPIHASADHIQAETHKAKINAHGVKSLSNNELQTVLTRMNLEQQHRNLQSQKPTKFEVGHKHVKRILSVAKTLNDIHSTVNGPIGKAVKTAVKAKTATE